MRRRSALHREPIRKALRLESGGRLPKGGPGLAYSGEFGFADTMMYRPINPMVVPKETALGCRDRRGDRGRMAGNASGYGREPTDWPGRGLRKTLLEVRWPGLLSRASRPAVPRDRPRAPLTPGHREG